MDDFDLQSFIPYALAVTAETVSRDFATIYSASHGLSRAEWRILCHLARAKEGLSVRDLEHHVHLERSKTSRAVTRMEEKGLVQKRPHDTDARLIAIALTDQGQDIYTALVPLAQAYQQSLLDRLTPEEAATIKTLLAKLTDTVGPETS